MAQTSDETLGGIDKWTLVEGNDDSSVRQRLSGHRCVSRECEWSRTFMSVGHQVDLVESLIGLRAVLVGEGEGPGPAGPGPAGPKSSAWLSSISFHGQKVNFISIRDGAEIAHLMSMSHCSEILLACLVCSSSCSMVDCSCSVSDLSEFIFFLMASIAAGVPQSTDQTQKATTQKESKKAVFASVRPSFYLILKDDATFG